MSEDEKAWRAYLAEYGPESVIDRAAALLAQALANNPVDRDLVTRAYAVLKGLE